MQQFTDLFALPIMALLSDIHQFLLDIGVAFATENMHQDVTEEVSEIHRTGQLHREVAINPHLYLDISNTHHHLIPFFNQLIDNDRKLFLITNSPFFFVNSGMRCLVGEHWRDYFDLVVCDARKPFFFSSRGSARPFRKLNLDGSGGGGGNNGSVDSWCDWSRVTELNKGSVYLHGNLTSLHEMTGWRGREVLYFGDHVYGDLADPALRNGWRTVAIIRELEAEIETGNREEYRHSVAWKFALERLIEKLQTSKEHLNINTAREKWKLERDVVKEKMKDLIHPQFGSIFRCYNNPSYFTRRLSRFADLYTSNLCNFAHYPVDHTFYPKRSTLPHERYFMRRPLFERDDLH